MKGPVLNFLPPVGWLVLSMANLFFAVASVSIENFSLCALNVMSAASCYLGYVLTRS